MLRKIFSRWVLSYLRFFARLQLAKVNPEIIGITGSAGKTSTLNAAEAVLSSKYSAKISKEANSESGIPLNILGLKLQNYSILDWLRVMLFAPVMLLINWKRFQKYVVEMGIDSPDAPKNMEYLLTIVHPRVGVFLNASALHSVYFETLIPEDIKENEQKRIDFLTSVIADEKSKLITNLPSGGFGILNTDDERVWALKDKTKARVISFGKKESADLRITAVKTGPDGFLMELKHEKKKYHLKLPQLLLSANYSYTLTAALAVGLANDVSLRSGIKGIENSFELPSGRMSLIDGIKSSVIIDSSYNSSRGPAIEALKLLGTFKKRRRIAVLGDMRELGKQAKLEHEKVADAAVKNADVIVTIGPLMKKYFIAQALKNKFDKKKIHMFLSSKKAAEFIRDNLIEEDDVVLVKGSQNTIFLERVVEALMKNPDQANKLLCRRGKFWNRIRKLSG